MPTLEEIKKQQILPSRIGMVDNQINSSNRATLKVVSGYTSSERLSLKSSNRRAVDESDNDSVDGGISATVKESDFKTPTSGSQNTIGNSQRQGAPG